MRLPKLPVAVEITAWASLYVLVLSLTYPRRVLWFLPLVGIYIGVRVVWAVHKHRAADLGPSR